MCNVLLLDGASADRVDQAGTSDEVTAVVHNEASHVRLRANRHLIGEQAMEIAERKIHSNHGHDGIMR